MYKVTLSMPIYNVAPYVERALLSALNQTFESIEFLLVDDRGTDNSMEIVRYIIKDHPRGKDVRIIEHPHNIGTGATKNTAIDNAQGEYLFFMDSDDEITPNCIQLLYDKMMEEKVDVVIGSTQKITNDCIISKVYDDLVIRDNYEILKNQYVDYTNKNYIYIMVWNKLYDISFIRKQNIRCIPNQLNEDNVFTTDFLFKASSCALISNITYNYYIISTSTTSKNSLGYSKKIADQYIDIMFYYKSKLDIIYPRLSVYYYYWVLSFMIRRMYGYIDGDLSKEEKCDYFNKLREGMSLRIGFNSLLLKSILKYICLMMPYSFFSCIVRTHRFCSRFY